MAARHGQLLNATLTLLKVNDIIARKQNTGAFRQGDRFIKCGQPGTPDIEGYFGKSWGPMRGQHIALEIKVGKDTLKPEQKPFLMRVVDNGGFALVVRDSVDELATILRERRKTLKEK